MGAPFTTDPPALGRIRAAALSDAAGCAAVYAPHVAHGTASFETEPPDAVEMARRMARCLDKGWPWLVAEGQDGTVLGYAYLGQFRDRAAYRHSAETSVYVADILRGRGVGKQLMQALLAEGDRAGFRQYVAVIGDSTNMGSIALHRSLGFRHVGTLTDIGLKFGRLLDVVYMQRG